MNKLLACMIFLTISLISQNALAAQVQIEGGSTANCIGPAGISGVSTPNEIITETGGYIMRNNVIPDIALTTSALFADKDFNLGYAQVSTTNQKTTAVSSSSFGLIPYNQWEREKNKYGKPMSWPSTNPQLALSLYYSGMPSNLKVTNVNRNINEAAYIWDSATSKRLFANTPVTSIYNIPFAYSKSPDSVRGIGWTNLGTSSSSAIGITNIWSYNSNGQMIDADIGLNKQWYGGWTTDYTTSWRTADTETIVLHELGHVLGLGDIYNSWKLYDTTEIMNSYAGSHRYLGLGDKAGIKAIYGA